MSAVILRAVEATDHEAVDALLRRAFEGGAEAELTNKLRQDSDVVLELVAERDGMVRGHVLFSRLKVEASDGTYDAVALAPVAVDPDHQREGIGAALIEEAHLRLEREGECLSVVLGDPAYYGRFGYSHERAAGFDSDYQCEALQARASGEAPLAGRLIYPRAFRGLG
ncbi:GNAT family N-acetyltransferase [Nitratireductor sp. CH_MIT9313-5]|jgi:putative acetyltransferase|uniref:GNAT family N-acetyltransferase n=1 Tax=Nitratireductor sp. CH_MIT9313-5 TaxID=3107764 RepID=UPI0030085244